MKKILLFIILLIPAIIVKAYTYEDAIKEVADAYYEKNRINNSSYFNANNLNYYNLPTYTGGVIQYDSKLKKFNFSPEDPQVDRLMFTVCSGVSYQIYKETFGISLPTSTKDLVKYARKRCYNSKTKEYNVLNTHEVHYASNNSTGLNSAKTIYKETDKLKFYKKFAKQYAPDGVLRVGDLVIFRWRTNAKNSTECGHVLMVYSVNEKTGDIVFMEAHHNNNDGDHFRNDIKTNTMYLNTKVNPLENYIFNKTDFYSRARKFLNYQNSGNKLLTKVVIIRPMESKEKTNINQPLNVNNPLLKNKTVTNATKERLNKAGLVISKVSSGHYGIVMPNERIEYKIQITAKKKDITLPKITETYDLSKVKVDADSIIKIKKDLNAKRTYAKQGIIGIEGVKVKKGQTITIKYGVIVRGNVYWGDKIKSTGYVGNIRNATITDKVGYKLQTTKEKQAFGQALKISSVKKGISYVNDVYINFYKRMGLNKKTVLYAGIGGSKIALYRYNKETKKFDSLLNSNNNFVERSYLRALGKYSLTEYHSLYSKNKKTISDYIVNNNYEKAARDWDANKNNYPVRKNLCDGDVIWISDNAINTSKGKVFKEYVFIYFGGKIYSNYTSKNKFANGNSILASQKLTERFLANLETFRAYAIFRPLQYYGIETRAVKLNYSINKPPIILASSIKQINYVESDEKKVIDDDDTGDVDKYVIVDNKQNYKYESDMTETSNNKDDTIIKNINSGILTTTKTTSTDNKTQTTQTTPTAKATQTNNDSNNSKAIQYVKEIVNKCDQLISNLFK